MQFHELTVDELRRLADDVSGRRGWDFSPELAHSDPVPWDYRTVVSNYLTQRSEVLDIGTGGGEVFLSFADSFGDGIGVDAGPEMIRVARENATSGHVNNVRFQQMRAESLDFPVESFDLVVSRHCSVDPVQVARVLRPGGRFITQGVGDRNDANIFGPFGWGSNGAFWAQRVLEEDARYESMASLGNALSKSGCCRETACEYEVRRWIKDVPSLIFHLNGAPFPEEFDPDRHTGAVNRLLSAHASDKGIETSDHRWLMVVRKLT